MTGSSATLHSIGFDVTQNDHLSGGFTWGFDKVHITPTVTPGNPGLQFNDPTRDWSTDAADRVHYVAANVGLIKAIPKTDVQFDNDSIARAGAMLYVLPANSTLVTPQPLPEDVE